MNLFDWEAQRVPAVCLLSGRRPAWSAVSLPPLRLSAFLSKRSSATRRNRRQGQIQGTNSHEQRAEVHRQPGRATKNRRPARSTSPSRLASAILRQR